MSQLFFWNSWNKPYKQLYWFLMLIFSVSIILCIAAFFFGSYLGIGWEIISKFELLRDTVDIFRIGTFDLSLPVDNLLIMESFAGGEITVHPWIEYSFLVLIAIGVIIALSVVTGLSRFWFIVGMLGFVILLLCFRFEQLLLFGATDNTALILLFVLYLPVSYYYHAIKPDTGFLVRIITFAAITFLLGLFIYFFSEIPYPFIYLSSYGLIAPVILSLIFIFLIAQDIIAGFLYLVTSGNNEYSKNSLLHFFAITLIYLTAVLLTLLKNTKMIDWDIFYLDAYFLLIISALVGIWWFRKRRILYENILPFQPLGGWLYLSLGIICFSTCAYFFATVNDPLIEAFEDAVIYAHLCLGGMFFLYILANFSSLLRRNMQVHKVLYKPRNMPFFMARIAGVIGVALLVFTSEMFPYHQSVAGYYNNLGDLYFFTGQDYLAERNYKIARQYEFQNHHSNYALASMAYKQNNQAEAITYFESALIKQPSDQAYVNLGRIYSESGNFFDALFTLREGLKAFPESGPIKNNLALLYSKTHVTDSAFLYLQGAFNNGQSRNSSEANTLALWGKLGWSMSVDSLRGLYKVHEYLPVKNNLLVLANINNQFIGEDITLFKNDSTLQYNKVIQAYSFTLNQLNGQDSSYIPMVDSLRRRLENSFFKEQMDLATALSYYYHHHVARAFILLNEIKDSGLRAGYYNYVLGLWALQQKAPELAVDYFEQALLNGYPSAVFGKALALSEAGELEAAAEEWTFLAGEDSITNEHAGQMLKVVSATSPWPFDEKSDEFRYELIRYHASDMSLVELTDEIEKIRQNFYKASAWLVVAELQEKWGEWKVLEQTLQKLNALNITDERIRERFAQVKMDYMVVQKDYEALAKSFEQFKNEFNNTQHTLYYQALLYQHEGETEKAEASFNILAKSNPFFEKGVLAAAQFYQKSNKEMLAYETLLEALRMNEKSIPLNKAYILQSLKMQLTSYAENAMDDLKEITTSKEFARFKKLYDSTATAVEQAF